MVAQNPTLPLALPGIDYSPTLDELKALPFGTALPTLTLTVDRIYDREKNSSNHGYRQKGVFLDSNGVQIPFLLSDRDPQNFRRRTILVISSNEGRTNVTWDKDRANNGRIVIDKYASILPKGVVAASSLPSKVASSAPRYQAPSSPASAPSFVPTNSFADRNSLFLSSAQQAMNLKPKIEQIFGFSLSAEALVSLTGHLALSLQLPDPIALPNVPNEIEQDILLKPYLAPIAEWVRSHPDKESIFIERLKTLRLLNDTNTHWRDLSEPKSQLAQLLFDTI